MTAADIEEALHRATSGALRFTAAPSTQTAAIVGYLRRAGLTRAELPHLAAVAADPGELWAWANVSQATVAWLAGKAHPMTQEYDCAHLQEALAEARRRATGRTRPQTQATSHKGTNGRLRPAPPSTAADFAAERDEEDPLLAMLGD